MRFRILLILVLAAWPIIPISAFADSVHDEKILREAKIAVDGPSLLDFLRKYTPVHIDPAGVAQLIKQLGSEDFFEREKASRALLALGPRGATFLRPVLQDPDPELAGRARRCLRVIDAGPGPEVQAAAVRLLAERKPAATAEVLLNYLPFAPDETVTKAIQQTLVAVALRDGKPDPALLAALTDKQTDKRLAAGEALLRAGVALPAVHKLLEDDDVQVRLRVALALIERKEKKAVPVLIDLLAKLPREQLGSVEEVLYRLAKDRAPTARLGSDSSPAKMRDLWAAWWKEHEAKIDLDPKAATPREFTLIVSMEEGKIVEIDALGKTRWHIAGLSFPMTAQILDKERVLVAEYRGMRVCERDFKGKILWEIKVPWPVAAQRFADGHTFIATRSSLIEVDKDGKEVYAHQMPGQIIMAAQKLRNGHIACMTSGGTFLLLDAKGKEVSRFQTGAVNFGCGFEVLANGNVLVPEYRGNQVVEWNPQGKKVWSVQVPGPQAAVRMGNGHTLVASTTERRVIEVDAAGRRVWEYRADFVPGRIQYR